MILSSPTYPDASNMRTKAKETFVSDFNIKYLTFCPSFSLQIHHDASINFSMSICMHGWRWSKPQKLITVEECTVKEKSGEMLPRISSLWVPVREHIVSFSVYTFVQCREIYFHF